MQQPFSSQGYTTPGNRQTVMQGQQGLQGNANLASNVTQGSVTQGLTGGMPSGLVGPQHQLFSTPQNYDQTQGEVWGLGQNSGQNVQWGNNR